MSILFNYLLLDYLIYLIYIYHINIIILFNCFSIIPQLYIDEESSLENESTT